MATSRSAPSSQKAGHQLDRVLGRGKADAQRRLRSPPDQGSRAQPVFSADQRVQPFQRQRQVGAALVVRNRVDLVHDHRLHRAKIVPALLRGQQNVQRLRRGYENVRRLLQHGAPLRGRCVPGAYRGPDVWAQVAALQRQLLNLPQWLLQVLLHIVAEGFKRGNVDHRGGRGQRTVDRFADQRIDTDQEGRQRLARAGGGGDQGRSALEDRGPAELLGRGRGTKLADKPLPHHWMRPGKRIAVFHFKAAA